LVFYVFPIIMGVSRVVMGRHYLSDVLFGLTLGCIEGHVAQLLPYSVIPFLKQSLPVVFAFDKS
uniref:AcidPPc domain-containing protein n=1 Tax=Anisakis simplex TaxID=6269 RepID=A0A0M3J579_ANISI